MGTDWQEGLKDGFGVAEDGQDVYFRLAVLWAISMQMVTPYTVFLLHCAKLQEEELIAAWDCHCLHSRSTYTRSV